MVKLSRRQLLKTSAISTALVAFPPSLFAAGREKLFIPPLMEARRGRPLILTMGEVTYPLDGEHYVDVWGFNGRYLGPTIKIRKGDFAKLNYSNNLPQPAAISIQGLQASGEFFGNAGRVLKTGETWAPIISINQSASTCWYRASTPTNSAYQTYRGLAGLWIIEDEETSRLTLPHKYGIDDIPLILQDMTFNNAGIQLFKPDQPHFMGTHLLINGQVAPYLEVSRGWVRVRLLNGSLSRSYELRFDDERDLYIIAQDLGFLSQPIVTKAFSLSPGERIEFLVDLSEGETVSLIAGHKQGVWDKIQKVFGLNEALADNRVLEFRLQGDLSVFTQQPSLQFNTDAADIIHREIVAERVFNLDTENGLINGKRFNPQQIDITAKLGTVERWRISANAPVGFFIQGAKFVIESLDDEPVPEARYVWRDTFRINRAGQILVKFDQPSSNQYPFIFGSSHLILADMGCIGTIVVQ